MVPRLPLMAGGRKGQSKLMNTSPPKDTRNLNRRTVLAGAACCIASFVQAYVPARAADAKIQLPMPGERDACPVCGMFPARYPDWIATVLYKDGHAHHFDGAKDMFKYLLDLPKYARNHSKEDISAIGVTDYYATQRIDARKALYIIGSDVLGPMGHDLIPHPDKYDAGEFMKDHKGKRLLTFNEITMPLLLGLDKGEFLMK